jgi:hypothetical protein
MEAAVSGMADAWRQRIAAHRASGQSIRAWCRDNNHHEHAFYRWRSRLGLSPDEKKGISTFNDFQCAGDAIDAGDGFCVEHLENSVMQ